MTGGDHLRHLKVLTNTSKQYHHPRNLALLEGKSSSLAHMTPGKDKGPLSATLLSQGLVNIFTLGSIFSLFSSIYLNGIACKVVRANRAS